VTLVHWGFALWGGVCCVGLATASSPWKPLWLVLVIPPQFVWLVWVVRRAGRAGLARW
jgi:hypothetical protein